MFPSFGVIIKKRFDEIFENLAPTYFKIFGAKIQFWWIENEVGEACAKEKISSVQISDTFIGSFVFSLWQEYQVYFRFRQGSKVPR